MSDSQPLHKIFKQEVDKCIALLVKEYPKHGVRRELSWVYASWELKCTEMTVRNYIEQKKIRNLKIPNIAEFLVIENIKKRIAEDKKNAKENR